MRMKTRLYTAVSCFILSILLLCILVPVLNHRLYPKAWVVKVIHPVEKGGQITAADIQPMQMGILALPEDVELTEEDVIGRYAAVDLVKEDVLFLSKLSQIPLDGDLPKDILPEGNQAQLLVIRMITGSEYPIPQTGDVVKLNSFREKPTDIPELRFVRILSVVSPKGKMDKVSVTVSLNVEQQKYICRHKVDGFYASVIVRNNEELAEKLLAEQRLYFEE